MFFVSGSWCSRCEVHCYVAAPLILIQYLKTSFYLIFKWSAHSSFPFWRRKDIVTKVFTFNFFLNRLHVHQLLLFKLALNWKIFKLNIFFLCKYILYIYIVQKCKEELFRFPFLTLWSFCEGVGTKHQDLFWPEPDLRSAPSLLPHFFRLSQHRRLDDWMLLVRRIGSHLWRREKSLSQTDMFNNKKKIGAMDKTLSSTLGQGELVAQYCLKICEQYEVPHGQ